MKSTPSIIIERQQAQTILACVQCGAEVEAACACHKPYKPAKVRVAEYDLANPGKSSRQVAQALDLSHTEVQRSRKAVGTDVPPDSTVTGKDGKTYSAKQPAKCKPTEDDRFQDLSARTEKFGYRLERIVGGGYLVSDRDGAPYFKSRSLGAIAHEIGERERFEAIGIAVQHSIKLDRERRKANWRIPDQDEAAYTIADRILDLKLPPPLENAKTLLSFGDDLSASSIERLQSAIKKYSVLLVDLMTDATRKEFFEHVGWKYATQERCDGSIIDHMPADDPDKPACGAAE